MVEVPIRVKLKLDANDLKRQLQGISGGIIGGAVGGRPTPTGKDKKTTGGLAILVDTIEPLLSPLLEIAQVIVKILGAIFAGLIILDLLVMFIKGVAMGFNTLNKMFGVLMALIGKMVEPFVNLLLPILIPVLIAMGFMAKIINTVLRPLFALMMKVFAGGFGQDLGALLGQLMLGQIDFGEFISGVADLFAAGFTQILESEEFAQVMEFVGKLLQALKDMLYAFLTMDFDALNEWLAQFLPEEVAGWITALAQAVHWVISALIGFAASFAGEEAFNEFMNQIDEDTEELKDVYNNLKETNEGFALGEKIGTHLQIIIDNLIDFAGKLVDDPIGTLWETFIDAIKRVIGGLKTLVFGTGEDWTTTGLKGMEVPIERPAAAGLDEILEREGLIGVINKLVEDLTGINFLEFWENLSTYWTETLKPALDSLVAEINDFITKTWKGKGGFKESFESLADSASVMADVFATITVSWIKGVIEGILEDIFGNGGGEGKTEGDFISRPGAGVISFSPNDTIIGTRNPAALLGAGGTTVNVSLNVSGSSNMSSAQFRQAVQQAMEDAMANASRNGRFQKGY